MRHINAPELAIFEEAAHGVLAFTDDEYQELQRIAEELKAVLMKAKQRLAA